MIQVASASPSVGYVKEHIKIDQDRGEA